MNWYRLFLLLIVLFNTTTLGYAKSVALVETKEEPYPREKVKPREKKQKKKPFWTINREKSKTEMSYPMLNFWLIFAIVGIVLFAISASFIFFGVFQWIVAVGLLFGGLVIAFLILSCILLIEVPSFPKVMDFVVTFFWLLALTLLLGIAFVIWGFLIFWAWAWIIGFILIFLAVLFFLIYWLIANADSKKG